jgi:hypothetical protein
MKREQELLIAFKLKDLVAKFETLIIKPRHNDKRENQAAPRQYGADSKQDK